MYTYTNIYRVAFYEFIDKYFILFIGVIITSIGLIIKMISMNYEEAINIYIASLAIGVLLSFSYMFILILKHIKNFEIELSETEISISKNRVLYTDLKEIYITKKNDLVLISNDNKKYKIYSSITNFESLVSILKKYANIELKNDNKSKIFYAMDLLIFIIFLLLNIPYIIIPIGLYLIFVYIKDIFKGIFLIHKISMASLIINLMMLGFVGYKLFIHFNYVIIYCNK